MGATKGERRRSLTSAFGEEDEEEKGTDLQLTEARAEAVKPQACEGEEGAWRVHSQDALDIGKAHCTLTTLQNTSAGLIRFEALNHSTADTMYLTCTDKQFN